MRKIREVSQQETRPADEDDQLFVCSVVKVGKVKKDNSSVWMETVKLNGREINCKVDTGSEVNIIPRQVYNQLTMGKLTKSSIVLEAYGGAKLNPIGKFLHVADCLSRNFSSEKGEDDDELNEMVHSVERHLRMSESIKEEFRKHSDSDEVLKQVIEYSLYGWADKSYEGELKAYYQIRNDIYRSNGLAERCVQTAKNMLKKGCDLDVALMEYRNTPLTGLKRTSAELLFSRKLKTKLPIVDEPKAFIKEFKQNLDHKKSLSKKYYDRHVRERAGFHNGDEVVFRNEAREWQPASIIASHESPRSYLINTGTNVLRRNSFHLRKSLANRQIDHTPCDLEYINAGRRISSTYVEADTSLIDSSLENPALTNNNQKPTSQGSARPSRTIRKPSRLNEYVVY
ncbi:hypothetical protein JTB14_022206 [Gonioctena quinquepunctata]|nr:hypothetical protein JTB14_022206 [Gonioctena quinquepunctata]